VSSTDVAAGVDVVVNTTAMASAITVRVTAERAAADAARTAAESALVVFHDVDRTCTRFDARSDLMRANAAPDAWATVSPRCLHAIAEAHAAYRRTAGRFDPRVLADLVRLGYDRSMRLGPPRDAGADALVGRAAFGEWRPAFRRATQEVNLGGAPIDLGGIGKGLALRWAAVHLHGVGQGHLIDAGGDCVCAGTAPDGGGWRVAVEDPRGGDPPVAVLGVTDCAVATSSVRVRSWRVGGAAVHHLIDPATGRPGGDGLLSVTVVDTDPAAAEVTSKCLFLAGARGIATAAEHADVAALWIDTEGYARSSPAMHPHLLWVAP
jgi:thiamine biosynthesis lipoprotein